MSQALLSQPYDHLREGEKMAKAVLSSLKYNVSKTWNLITITVELIMMAISSCHASFIYRSLRINVNERKYQFKVETWPISNPPWLEGWGISTAGKSQF